MTLGALSPRLMWGTSILRCPTRPLTEHEHITIIIELKTSKLEHIS